MCLVTKCLKLLHWLPKHPMDTSVLDSLAHTIKSCVATVLRNVDPLYICYSKEMEVLGNRLTKAVSESV